MRMPDIDHGRYYFWAFQGKQDIACLGNAHHSKLWWIFSHSCFSWMSHLISDYNFIWTRISMLILMVSVLIYIWAILIESVPPKSDVDTLCISLTQTRKTQKLPHHVRFHTKRYSVIILFFKYCFFFIISSLYSKIFDFFNKISCPTVPHDVFT